MEVVCLILGPMLAFRPCSHAFWVLTSLHLLSFFKLYILVFFLNGTNIFVDCRNTGVSCITYEVIQS